jgi:NAD(P)-dependent dehydrogenase (short-subunit alcohol dehydrogenase family)
VATRTAQGFEMTVGVNHLGHFLLANLLLPTLARESANPFQTRCEVSNLKTQIQYLVLFFNGVVVSSTARTNTTITK